VPVAVIQIWSTSRRACAFVAGVVLLAAAAAALLAPSTATASACGDAVLDDWWDNGRIDRLYPTQCYQDAIDSIPSDLRDYANVEEVITRALQAALNGNGPGGPSDPDEQPTGSPNKPADPDVGGNDKPSEALDDVDAASSPSSIPIPLLLLAAMSTLLLGAGGLGYLSRRRNGEALDEPGDVPPDDEIRG
jgi:hypothetical protein